MEINLDTNKCIADALFLSGSWASCMFLVCQTLVDICYVLIFIKNKKKFATKNFAILIICATKIYVGDKYHIICSSAADTRHKAKVTYK